MLSVNVYGQKNTFLTCEIGILSDNATLINPERNVDFYNYCEPVTGLLLTQQISKSIYLESGIYIFSSTEFDMKSISADNTNFNYLLEEHHIPIRIRLQKSFLNERINPFFTIGTTIAFNAGEDCDSRLYSLNDESSIVIQDDNYLKNRMLIELGAGVDFCISKNLFLGLRYKYNYSLKEQVDMYAITRNNRTAEITNYKLEVPGHNHSLSISVSYRISSYWNK